MKLQTYDFGYPCRIGTALLGMAIESTTSASEVNRYIRERARVGEEQKLQLKRFEGRNAIATLSQSVGTLGRHSTSMLKF